MLSLTNVSAGYGSGDVLKNITLTVSAGCLSIVGPNGCGKTTLLRAVTRILPFKGDITLGGKSVRKMSQRELSLKIAMLSQISEIYFSYSVFDTVMMGRYLHVKDRLLGIPSAADRECVMSCLATAGLTGEKDRPITELSGGQLQRVFLARTLAQEPEIILLDEPTNHLDLKYQIELIEYLKAWSAQGGRIVVGVMHDINLAMRLSDTLMVMHEGTVAAIGEACEVITGGHLERVYGIDVAGYMRDSLRIWDSIGDKAE